MSTSDTVNHPSHYTNGKIECIDAIEDMIGTWDGPSGYRLGNVLKYIWRHKLKNDRTSLLKARWYLDREIHAQQYEIKEQLD